MNIKTENVDCSRGMSLEGLRAGQMCPHITGNFPSGKEWQPDYSPASAFNAQRDHMKTSAQEAGFRKGTCLCGSEGFH